MKGTKVLPLKGPLQDMDFKLFIKKQDSEGAFDPPLYCPRDSDREKCFRKEILGCGLSLI